MRFRARCCCECGLRFPVEEGSPLGAACPRCDAPTEFVDEGYETEQARADPDSVRGLDLSALLDNVRSVRNVGSMFRTADGAGLSHMYLAGFTATPEHPRMRKTSLGAEGSVAWSQHPDCVAAASLLSSEGRELWALEGGSDGCSIFDAAIGQSLARLRSIVLVVGHEVSGVDPRVVEQCSRMVQIPMAGTKGSLNVGVAFGIAAYTLRHGWRAERAGELASDEPASS